MRRLWLLVPVLLAVWLMWSRGGPRGARTARPRESVQVGDVEAVGGGGGETVAAAPEQTHEDAEIDRLLDILQSAEYREEEKLLERGLARARLVELVTPEVAAEAISTLMTPGGHKRAQLLLAFAPAQGLEVLLEAPDPLVRLYARLRLDGPIPPERIHDPGLYRPGTGHEPLPVKRIFEMVFVPKELRKWKEEYESDYEHEFLSLLREIDKHIPAHRRILADLDGDGRDELFLDGTHVWETSWRHDEGFLAVIGSDGDVNWLQSYEARTERVVVADADGNGTPEIYCWLAIGGHGAYGLLGCYASGAAILTTGHKWHDVGVADGPLFFSQSHYQQANVGTYGIEIGVLAREIELHRWKQGFWPVGKVYLPLER